MILHCNTILGWVGTTWANEINFVMNHAPGAGSITRPVDQHPIGKSMLYYRSPVAFMGHTFQQQATHGIKDAYHYYNTSQTFYLLFIGE